MVLISRFNANAEKEQSITQRIKTLVTLRNPVLAPLKWSRLAAIGQTPPAIYRRCINRKI